MLAAAGPDGDTVKVSRPISQGSQRASHPCRVLFVCFGSSSFCSESDDGSGGFPCHLGSDDRKPGRTYAQAWGRFRCLVLRRRCASGREGEQLQQPRQRLGKSAVRAAFAVPDVLASRRAILVSAPQWPRQPRPRPSVWLCWWETPPTDAAGDGTAFPLVTMPGLPGDPRLLPGPEGHGLLLRAWRWGHVTCLALLWPSPWLARLLFSSGNFRELNQYL